MNNIELKQKVYSVMNNILSEKNHISPVDVLINIGILSNKDYEDWRFGRVPYLEKVCKCNLNKLSFILTEISTFARHEHNQLKPSKTVYNQWGVKGKKIPLRFSKSRNLNIEVAYTTHYVIASKLEEKIDKGDR